MDDGKNSPQAEIGGIVSDEKFVYWNSGGKILRISKDGGKPETVAAENVGIGIDMTIDNEKVYWANHAYYSSNSPSQPRPIYAVSKQGGRAEIFADEQKNPASLVADKKFVYWVTTNSILKRAKSGGQVQIIYQATDKEGVDVLTHDDENLYFGFRGAGASRWALRKISKQGGEPQTLVKTFSLKSLVVDDANIYFFDEDSSSKNALCKVSKNGGEVTKFDVGYSSGVIAQSKTQIYFASLDDIYSFPK